MQDFLSLFEKEKKSTLTWKYSSLHLKTQILKNHWAQPTLSYLPWAIKCAEKLVTKSLLSLLLSGIRMHECKIDEMQYHTLCLLAQR